MACQQHIITALVLRSGGADTNHAEVFASVFPTNRSTYTATHLQQVMAVLEAHNARLAAGTAGTRLVCIRQAALNAQVVAREAAAQHGCCHPFPHLPCGVQAVLRHQVDRLVLGAAARAAPQGEAVLGGADLDVHFHAGWVCKWVQRATRV